MNWDLIFQIGNFAIGVIGVIGGIGGVIFWRAARKEKEAAAKEKEANAQAASIDAKAKEADLVDTILQRFEKAVIGRMDQGEAVRKKEFDQLRLDLGGQLTNIQAENRSQNSLLQNIVEYLDGPFSIFLAEKAEQAGATKQKTSKKSKR